MSSMTRSCCAPSCSRSDISRRSRDSASAIRRRAARGEASSNFMSPQGLPTRFGFPEGTRASQSAAVRQGSAHHSASRLGWRCGAPGWHGRSRDRCPRVPQIGTRLNRPRRVGDLRPENDVGSGHQWATTTQSGCRERRPDAAVAATSLTRRRLRPTRW
jgi:hypothetical protein